MRTVFHHQNLKRIIHSRYYDLVIADILRNFAFAMISLFIPLFLIEKGFSVYQVLFFYLFFYIFSVIGHYLLLKTIHWIGIKQGLIISYFAEIVVYFILYNYGLIISVSGEVLYLAVLFVPFVLASIFYWTSHHIYFFVSSHSHNEGRKLGLLYSIPNLLVVFAPFTGGAIITFAGFKLAYLVSMMLLLLASVALLQSRKIEVDIKVSFDKILDVYQNNKNWIYFIDGANYFATALVWPLYMFFAAINFLSMGIVYIFSNVFYSLSCFFGGRISDKIGVRKLGRIGALGHSVSLVLRAFSESLASMSFALSAGGAFGGMMHISVDSGFYKHSHENIGSAIMNREIYMHSGRIFLLAILMFGIYLFGVKSGIVIVFLFAAFLTFILNFFIKKDKSIID